MYSILNYCLGEPSIHVDGDADLLLIVGTVRKMARGRRRTPCMPPKCPRLTAWLVQWSQRNRGYHCTSLGALLRRPKQFRINSVGRRGSSLQYCRRRYMHESSLSFSSHDGRERTWSPVGP